MKAVITRIESGKVFAKTVNPLGEDLLWEDYNVSKANLAKWQQAESERLELPIDKGDISAIALFAAFLSDHSTLKIGDTIEVTREGNYFKII